MELKGARLLLLGSPKSGLIFKLLLKTQFYQKAVLWFLFSHNLLIFSYPLHTWKKLSMLLFYPVWMSVIPFIAAWFRVLYLGCSWSWMWQLGPWPIQGSFHITTVLASINWQPVHFRIYFKILLIRLKVKQLDHNCNTLTPHPSPLTLCPRGSPGCS